MKHILSCFESMAGLKKVVIFNALSLSWLQRCPVKKMIPNSQGIPTPWCKKLVQERVGGNEVGEWSEAMM